MTGRLVKDINSNGSSSPNELIDIEGILYFVADSGAAVEGSNNSGVGLWKSDGSDGGTRLLRSFKGVSNLVEAGGMLYFVGQDEDGYAIWSSDGTSAGTVQVDALNPGTDNFAAYNLFAVNDTLFFSASGSDGSSNGYELWRWQGEDVGTKLFKNLFPDRYITRQAVERDEDTGLDKLTVETSEFNSNNPGFSTDSFPSNFTAVGGDNFFFTAYSTYLLRPERDERFIDEYRIGGIELWFSDGTENGTYTIPINEQTYTIYNPEDGSSIPPQLRDASTNYIAKGSSFPKNLTYFANNLYFSANDGKSGFELWTINNKGKGETKVSELNKDLRSIPSPESLTVAGNKLYFTIDNGNGRELWSLNKNNKAEKVKSSGDDPRHLTEIDGNLYYSASSGKGREPWVIKNNDLPKQLQDINPGIKSSNPKQFQLIRENTEKGGIKKTLYFSANGGKRGIELWSQNISKDNNKAERYADIYSGEPSSDPRNLISTNNELFFTANDGKSGRELWTIDTPDPLQKPESCNPSSTNKCDQDQKDESGDNTILVKNIRPDAQGSDPNELYNHRGELFLSANNGSNGFEPWTTQGTKKSTKLFKDINKGRQSSSPSSFTSHKTSLFFSADDGRKGSELWISNGNANGTKLAADIQRGQKSSSPASLLTQGKNLFMSADDGTHGRELWSYEINSGEYALVRDIRSGSRLGSNPSELTSLNGQIIFAAKGDTYGRELWSSDGTKSGTKMLLDINPGGLDSNPKDLSLFNGNLYFTGNTYFNGRQILKLDGIGLNVTAVRGSLEESQASEPSELHASRDQLFFSAETTLDSSQEEDDKTTSSTGGSANSDPGGFMTAASGIDAKSIEYINNYNDQIDSYRKSNDNDYLGIAKSWAELLVSSSLVDNNDSSLALDWNRYFQSESDSSPIQIPNNLPADAASRSTTSSPGGSNLTQPTEGSNSDLGRELWVSNGKVNGNTLLKDIFPGKGSSNPQGFTSVGTQTYFSADDGQSGEELWVSDGTEAGTFLLSDINAGSKDSSPRSITDVNGAIYFSAKTDGYGRELWRLVQPKTSKTRSTTKNSSRGQDLDLTRLVYDIPGKGRLRGKRNTSDEFTFSRKNQFGPKNADHIIDFSAEEGDSLQLNTEVFSGLKRRSFKSVKTLQGFNRQMEQVNAIIYFQPLGELYLNQNGSKPGLGNPKDSGLFAVLKGAPELNQANIELI